MKTGGAAVKWTITVGLVILAPLWAIGQDKAEKPGTQQQQEEQKVVYKPPARGMPSGRIGAAVRGGPVDTAKFGGKLPVLTVLAPDHVGLTTKAQPVLYWYLSSPISEKVEFSLNDEKSGKTVIQKELASSAREGIQRVKLADLGASLSPETEYTWFISVVLDPTHPSKDLTCGGSIKLVSAPASLARNISGARAAAAYAAEGIWYDALAAISDQIEANPGDMKLRCVRADLLDQAEVPAAGKADCSR